MGRKTNIDTRWTGYGSVYEKVNFFNRHNR